MKYGISISSPYIVCLQIPFVKLMRCLNLAVLKLNKKCCPLVCFRYFLRFIVRDLNVSRETDELEIEFKKFKCIP